MITTDTDAHATDADAATNATDTTDDDDDDGGGGDVVGGLGKKYILLNWRIFSHHDAQFVKPIWLKSRKPGKWRWKAL